MTNDLRPEPNQPQPPVSLGSVVFGLLLALFGFALLAGNLGWFDVRHLLWRFWPTALIVGGIAILLQRRHRQSLWGFILIFWGAWLYADHLNWIRVPFWAVFGPTLIVLAGGAIMWRAVGTRIHTPSGVDVDSGSFLRSFAVLSGSETRPTSKAFKGAELTAVMGGVKLDLNAAEPEGDSVVIDVFAMMGGIEIYVPRNWELVNQ